MGENGKWGKGDGDWARKMGKDQWGMGKRGMGKRNGDRANRERGKKNEKWELGKEEWGMGGMGMGMGPEQNSRGNGE